MKVSKLITAIALAAQALTGALAHAETEGGHGGNGGGLINRDGRLMTFYSAGFYTEPVEATSDEVPQLSQTLDVLEHTTVISEMTKVKYASNLIPSSARRYFKVKEDSFTAEVRNNLIAVYGRQMNVDTRQVALAAITDTQSKTTYLLPNFYKLTPIEQQTILFHETYWLVNPTATYQQVVEAEMTFQAYVSSPTSPDRIIRFAKAVGQEGDVWTAAIRSDLATNALAGFTQGSHYEKQNHRKVLVSGSVITLGQLFGPQTFACAAKNVGKECQQFFALNLYTLTRQYPQSLFLRLVSDYVAHGNYDTHSYYSGTIFESDLNEHEAEKIFDLNSVGYTQSTTFSFRSVKPNDNYGISPTIEFRTGISGTH